MIILAIDTTGFSAGLALVKNGQEVLLNRISSGFAPNKNWWDFPYLLPIFHQKFILRNIKKLNWREIDAIAVSANSGIYNCIVAGVSIAETLAKVYQKPLIEVDHLLAHIYSPWLERNPDDFSFPVLVFSASGSHSDFALLKNIKNCEIIAGAVPKQNRGGIETFLGIGKVFYQFGKSLGVITSNDEGVEGLMKAALKGNPYRLDFIPYYKGSLLDLNFAGFLGSAVKFIKKRSVPTEDAAASFQESITEILAGKILRLAGVNKAKEIHLAGGISENRYLEKKLKDKIKKGDLSFALRYPVRKQYRLDNAAMIGCLAYYQKKCKVKFKNFEPNVTR